MFNQHQQHLQIHFQIPQSLAQNKKKKIQQNRNLYEMYIVILSNSFVNFFIFFFVLLLFVRIYLLTTKYILCKKRFSWNRFSFLKVSPRHIDCKNIVLFSCYTHLTLVKYIRKTSLSLLKFSLIFLGVKICSEMYNRYVQS